MVKCEIRKQMLRYKRWLKELQQLHIFSDEEKERKKRDIIILKQKIKLLQEKLDR